MANTGRPSKYTEAYAAQAEKLCRLGATDEELADFFDVDRATIYRWKHMYPAFCDALKAGKDQADERVERSLYHRAIGYQHDDVHISNYQGAITETPVVKHYPPDTTAGIFWLKNRRPDQWRDKQDHEHSGPNGGPIAFLDLSDADRKKRIDELIAKRGSGTGDAA